MVLGVRDAENGSLFARHTPGFIPWSLVLLVGLAQSKSPLSEKVNLLKRVPCPKNGDRRFGIINAVFIRANANDRAYAASQWIASPKDFRTNPVADATRH